MAVLLSGAVRPATWRDAEPATADFFAAKGVLAGMLDTVHVPWTLQADPEAAPFLHPGRAARIVIGGIPRAGSARSTPRSPRAGTGATPWPPSR